MAEPLPICYLNGDWLPLREARISPLDRSFLFGDGIYEVVPVFAGRPFRFMEHFDRLTRSADGIRLRDPHTRDEWRAMVRELMARNGGGDLYVYVQVSRVFAFCAPLPQLSAGSRATGLSCITAEDTRWARCDIKSTALLANVLLRQLSVDVDAHETILLRDGELMEASASTVHIVSAGRLVTPPDSRRILPGTTRSVVEELADRIGLPRETRTVTEAELRAADEIWLASATRRASPVTRLDGAPVGSGLPGPAWQRLDAAFTALIDELSGQPW
jgi:D-alanine transaminase